MDRLFAMDTEDIKAHRKEFNLKAFGLASASRARRKLYTISRYEEIVKRLRYWDVVDGHIDPATGQHISQKQLHESCESKWFDERHRYKLETTYSNSTSIQHLMKCERKSDRWRIVVPQECIFDAIHACHIAARHKKNEVTWKLAKKTYYNLTDDLVRTFVATCPVCNGPADNPVFTAGNKYRFRDQYTTTIIDQSRDPVTDFNGVTMRYLLVVQDNATKFTVLRPIRRVDPCVLKCELKFIFGMIGYPRKTFKSDEDYVELQSGLIRKLIHQRNSECAYELGAV